MIPRRPLLAFVLILILGLLSPALIAPRQVYAHSLSASAAPPLSFGYAQAALSAPSEQAIRLRIGVTADGIVRLTPVDLQAAGVDPAAIDPRTFVMSSQGQVLAIRVTGESDGHFDAGDAIEFFGRRFRASEQDEKYTDEAVYWLDTGGNATAEIAANTRIPDVDAAPTGQLTPPVHFPTTVRAEQNNYWFTLYTTNPPSKDTWFWEQLRPVTSEGITRTFPADIPYPAPATAATLWVDQYARASANHLTGVSLNGVTLGVAAWAGVTRSHTSFSVPPGLLSQGANVVSVHARLTPQTLADWVYVNYWEIHYQRLFRAWQGQIDFEAEASGPQEYLIDGWLDGLPGTSIAVWDITSPNQPMRLTGATLSAAAEGSALRFRVADDAPGRRYWLQSEANVPFSASTPGSVSIRLRPPTGLRNPATGSDVVIITSAALRPAAERLAAFDRQRGHQVLVADFLDVVDEFNDGIYHPRAVPAMLLWAQSHWPDPKPRYLTLFGDGHWNFKGYNPTLYPPQPQHIPPYLAWVDPTQGEVPADPWYGDLNGDRLPDLAVGRIAVNTLAEADAVLDKLESYDESGSTGPWQQKAIFIADNEDEAGDFPQLSDIIIHDYLPSWFGADRIYLEHTVPDGNAARAAIRDAIDAGALMLQYTGHGNPPRWANELIWTLDDVPSLRNGSRLPVVMSFNCLDGYFAHPQPMQFSLAETMQRLPNGGSVAAISPSGLGFTYDQHQFRRLLMQSVFHDGIHTLGDALLHTQQRYYAQTGPHYLIDTMMLYGDPTLVMPLAQERIFLPWALSSE